MFRQKSSPTGKLYLRLQVDVNHVWAATTAVSNRTKVWYLICRTMTFNDSAEKQQANFFGHLHMWAKKWSSLVNPFVPGPVFVRTVRPYVRNNVYIQSGPPADKDAFRLQLLLENCDGLRCLTKELVTDVTKLQLRSDYSWYDSCPLRLAGTQLVRRSSSVQVNLNASVGDSYRPRILAVSATVKVFTSERT